MGQYTFFVLFAIALIAGAFTYFVPAQKTIDPMKFVMEGSGIDSVEVHNNTKTQQFNMVTSKGLIKIRSGIDNLALQQNKFLNTIRDQEHLLDNSVKDATDIIWEVKQKALTSNKDILQLQALAAEMQDQQRLLINHGHDLLVLNDQLAANRQWIVDQMDMVSINNESASQELQQRYSMLKDQAATFFDKVNQHNQELRDRMDKIQDQLNTLANNAAYDSAIQQQQTRDRIERMLDKEHEDMLKIADTEERSRNLLKDAQETMADAKELTNDSLQHTQELIADQRQRSEDQLWIMKQREADQEQRLQDQQNR